MGMVTTCTEETDIDSHHHRRTIETMCYNNIAIKVVTKGGLGPDMDHLMNFWGTPKIKKFLNISIKVYEDEICSTSVWYR